MQATQAYKYKLNSIIQEIQGLSPTAIMCHPEWSVLTKLITPEVLLDAHSYQPSLPLPAVHRPCKTITRVLNKALQGRADTHFKVNSDLSAFRIEVQPHEIRAIIVLLKASFPFLLVRNSVIDDEGNPTDIVCVCMGYNGEYLVELQVIHPFASYVFKRDSLLRDMSPAAAVGLIDLWDQGFYTHVRNVILGRETSEIPERLARLYGSRPVEPELLDILAGIDETRAYTFQ